MSTTAFEFHEVDDDPGVGNGYSVSFDGTLLTPIGATALDLLNGLRRRNPGFTDVELADLLDGAWSNGYIAARSVPTPTVAP